MCRSCQNYRTELGEQRYGKIPYFHTPPDPDSARIQILMILFYDQFVSDLQFLCSPQLPFYNCGHDHLDIMYIHDIYCICIHNYTHTVHTYPKEYGRIWYGTVRTSVLKFPLKPPATCRLYESWGLLTCIYVISCIFLGPRKNVHRNQNYRTEFLQI
jgi:hypothetical protein